MSVAVCSASPSGTGALHPSASRCAVWLSSRRRSSGRWSISFSMRHRKWLREKRKHGHGKNRIQRLTRQKSGFGCFERFIYRSIPGRAPRAGAAHPRDARRRAGPGTLSAEHVATHAVSYRPAADTRAPARAQPLSRSSEIQRASSAHRAPLECAPPRRCARTPSSPRTSGSLLAGASVDRHDGASHPTRPAPYSPRSTE